MIQAHMHRLIRLPLLLNRQILGQSQKKKKKKKKKEQTLN